ncbi:hypothetical protein LCGC14_1110380 [marine sediment metagenome]|uniref:Uncharacterized protein n=1 Tax=marine sediment metagenome TaxID=412755 RepID=A0A0F9QD07_9ZZZZ
MSQKSKSKEQSVQTTGLSQYQKDIAEGLGTTYAPFIGQGSLGGLSDLGQQSIDMLKSANIWGPLTNAATGLLTGTTGAQPITGDAASAQWRNIQDQLTGIEENIARPARKEAFAGPGYWSSARREGQITGYGPGGRQGFGDYLGDQFQRFQFDVDAVNRNIEEAKAGRALSALGIAPDAIARWTGTLFGTGEAAKQITEAITDPSVLNVLMQILGIQTQPITGTTRTTNTPSDFQQAANWAGVGLGVAKGIQGLNAGGGAGGGALGSVRDPYSPVTRSNLGGYGGGF